jgi:hypothetical protein
VGVAVWLVGLAFESIGDAQLKQFKADPANKGMVMDRGLWAFTRHPNYFGDACVWWGIYLVAADSGLAGAATILSPVAMTYFLVFATGARLLEKTMMQREGYPEYAERTEHVLPVATEEAGHPARLNRQPRTSRLDHVGQLRHRPSPVQLHGGARPQPWLDRPRVLRDLGPLLLGRPVRVVRTPPYPLEEHVDRGAEQHHVLEPVVEASLVRHRAGHDDVRLGRQESRHPVLVPGAVRQLPPVVVGVDGQVSRRRSSSGPRSSLPRTSRSRARVACQHRSAGPVRPRCLDEHNATPLRPREGGMQLEPLCDVAWTYDLMRSVEPSPRG